MRWTRIVHQGTPRVGYLVEKDSIQLVDAQSLLDVIGGREWSKVGQPVALDQTRILPLLTPGKIICVGLNYPPHCVETNYAIPKSPVVFAKFGNAVAGHGEPIRWPVGLTEQVDYEAELGVIIGKRAKNVSQSDALNHVFGYVAVNDVSARDIQIPDGQWVRGKSLDGFCPFGPFVVSTDEISDVQSLAIKCVINGQTLQDSNTRHMIFPVDYLVSFISRTTTLEPGDLILTGTPDGVGLVRKPPIFLKRGDKVDVVIDKVGRLSNPVEGPVPA
jgi:2-keto-4-pentenoate hydratase/2-oxohepta-3-ene-1,7-dioic acid hydratase in catechol pathway